MMTWFIDKPTITFSNLLLRCRTVEKPFALLSFPCQSSRNIHLSRAYPLALWHDARFSWKQIMPVPGLSDLNHHLNDSRADQSGIVW